MRSYFESDGLPVVTTHRCNNNGPYQLPEKLIPVMIVMISVPLPTS